MNKHLPEPPNFNDITPEWVKSEMKKHKMTQEKLGSQIGQDKHYISSFLGGKRSISNAVLSAFYHFFKRLEGE